MVVCDCCWVEASNPKVREIGGTPYDLCDQCFETAVADRSDCGITCDDHSPSMCEICLKSAVEDGDDCTRCKRRICHECQDDDQKHQGSVKPSYLSDLTWAFMNSQYFFCSETCYYKYRAGV